MKKLNLAKGLLTVPGLSLGADMLRNTQVGDTIGQVAGGVNSIMEVGNSLLNPLFSTAAGGASAGFITNTILKDLGLYGGEDNLTKKDFLRYGLNTAALTGAVAVGSVATPYIVGGSIAYWAGKHGWKFGKEAAKRVVGTGWGLTAGTLKAGIKGGLSSAKAGLKGEQKINPIV